jgi:hypothetical protein
MILNRENIFVFVFALVYFIFSFTGILHHELWLDEAHHWLLARDSNNTSDLFNKIRYEGHPVLWNLILFVITRFTRDPTAMQIIHILISTCAIAIVLKHAPFKKNFKILFIFGYFMLFEYNLISRNYMLGILLLFTACILLKNRSNNFIVLSAVLALAANAHLITGVIAAALFIMLCVENFQNNTLFTQRKFNIGYMIFVIGILAMMAQVIPPNDTLFFEPIDEIPFTFKLTKGLSTLMKGLFPIPDFSSIHFWNTNMIVSLSKPLAVVFALLSYFIPLLLFYKKKYVLCFVYVAIVGLQLFFFVTQRGAARFDGMSYIVIFIGLWIERYFADDHKPIAPVNSFNLGKLKAITVYTILLIHFASGVYAYTMDFIHPFNASKLTVDYLEKNQSGKPVVTFFCDGTAISAYSNKKIYFLCSQREQSYCDWNSGCNINFSETLLGERLADYFKDRTKKKLSRCIYITNKKLKKPATDKWTMVTNSISMRFVKAFDSTIVANGGCFIYEVSVQD